VIYSLRYAADIKRHQQRCLQWFSDIYRETLSRFSCAASLLKQGVLDERGQISVDHQVVTRSYKLEMANGVSYQIPVAEAYSRPEQGEHR
ncbi:hypothetical protein ACB371_22390, partial [Klebsiella pneumoniae]